MKEINDEKLQELLFEALDTAPASDLPDDFSVKVVAKLRSRKQRMADIRFYIIVTFCCLFVGGSTVAVLTRFGHADMIMSYISRYGVIFVLGTIILLLIQYLDQKLVKQAFLKER